MSRDRGEPILDLDLEIERTCKQNRKQTKNRKESEKKKMAANNQQDKLIREYTIPNFTPDDPIKKTTTAANNFEVKPALVNMLQQNARFHGLPSEDPNDHLRKFLRLCNGQTIKDVSEEAVRLSLFPYSLCDKADEWFSSLPADSITTWDDLVRLFLSEYFPSNKYAQLCSDIRGFQQRDDEDLYEAFERFKRLLRKCPNHDIPRWTQVRIFYDGLYDDVKNTLDAASSGGLHNKTEDQAWELLQDMALNARYRSDRSSRSRPRPSGVMNVNAETRLSTQLAQLSKKFDDLSSGNSSVYQIQSSSCEICGSGHPARECPMVASHCNQSNEDVNYVGNQSRQRNDPYSNTYNPGWRQHPNLSWGGQNSGGQNSGQSNQGYQGNQGGSQRSSQGGFQNTQGFQNNQGGNQKPSVEDMVFKMVQSQEAFMQNQNVIMQNMQTQIG